MIDLFKAEWVSSVCVQVSRNGRTDQVWVQLFYYFVFGDSMLLFRWVGGGSFCYFISSLNNGRYN